MSLQFDVPDEYSQPMDTAMSATSQEFPALPSAKSDALHNGVPYDVSVPAPKLHKAPSSNF